MGLTGRSAILQVHPTRRCNLRCRHCYSSSGPWVSETTDLSLLERAVVDARTLGYDVVSVSGGEPLLFPGLLPLLRQARAAGMRTTVTSNGMLLTPRRLSELAELVDVLAISLDGRPGTHEWMRGDRRAFRRMAARLPAVRDSGIRFAFITTLSMHNVHELEFVFELAASSGAALVQVHPLEPEGVGAELVDSVPDSTELAYAFFEATRLGVVHEIPVQVDVVSRSLLLSAPERFLVTPPDPGAPLGTWLSPLVVETDGSVVPLSYGFGREYALGSLRSTSLADLAQRWDTEPLRRLATELHSQLVRDEVRFSNWYERMVRLSVRPSTISLVG